MRAHEVPDEKPDPEKVDERPNRDRRLEQEAKQQLSEQVDLGHDLVWDLHRAGNEWHTGVKEWLDILLFFLGERVSIELYACRRADDRRVLQRKRRKIRSRLLPQAHEQSHHYKVDGGIGAVCVRCFILRDGPQAQAKAEMSQAGECATDCDEHEKVVSPPGRLEGVSVASDHIIHCAEVQHHEERIRLDKYTRDKRPHVWDLYL